MINKEIQEKIKNMDTILYNTSYPEKVICYYMNRYLKNVQANYRPGWLHGLELDVFLPQYNIGIEYNGEFYHSIKKAQINGLRKEYIMLTLGYPLIKINENAKNKEISIKTNITNGKIISIDICKLKNYDDLQIVISKIINNLKNIYKDINEKIDIDIKRDKNKIDEFIRLEIYNNSFYYNHPELIKEWDYKNNKHINILQLSKNSQKKVWWKCKLGHEWKTTVYSRTSRQSGCPYCASRKILKGFNDLLTVNPQLAKEWNYKKNGKLKPTDVMANSNKKVWWKCKLGHEWEATVIHRNRGSGCPYCSNKKLLKGFNDLLTINPQLAEEWSYEKNDDLKADNILSGSSKKVWWKCKLGHEWEATVISRNKGTGCPYCSNKKILKGYNDLATTNPQLAKQWSYNKNDNLKPTDVTAGSNKKVWWKCKLGHEWEATIYNRANGKGCPYCSKRNTYKRFNV